MKIPTKLQERLNAVISDKGDRIRVRVDRMGEGIKEMLEEMTATDGLVPTDREQKLFSMLAVSIIWNVAEELERYDAHIRRTV